MAMSGDDYHLPRQFVSSLKVLFNILDTDKVGFVKISDIEARWQSHLEDSFASEESLHGLANSSGVDIIGQTVLEGRGSSLLHSVIDAVRKNTPHDGYVSFNGFIAGMRTALREFQVSRATSKQEVFPSLSQHQSAPVEHQTVPVQLQGSRTPPFVHQQATQQQPYGAVSPTCIQPSNIGRQQARHLGEAVSSVSPAPNRTTRTTLIPQPPVQQRFCEGSAPVQDMALSRYSHYADVGTMQQNSGQSRHGSVIPQEKQVIIRAQQTLPERHYWQQETKHHRQQSEPQTSKELQISAFYPSRPENFNTQVPANFSAQQSASAIQHAQTSNSRWNKISPVLKQHSGPNIGEQQRTLSPTSPSGSAFPFTDSLKRMRAAQLKLRVGTGIQSNVSDEEKGLQVARSPIYRPVWQPVNNNNKNLGNYYTYNDSSTDYPSCGLQNGADDIYPTSADAKLQSPYENHQFHGIQPVVNEGPNTVQNANLHAHMMTPGYDIEPSPVESDGYAVHSVTAPSTHSLPRSPGGSGLSYVTRAPAMGVRVSAHTASANHKANSIIAGKSNEDPGMVSRRANHKQRLQSRAEPRRHTFAGSGLDASLLKKAKLLDQTEQVLSRGLDAIELARTWYMQQLTMVIASRDRLAGASPSTNGTMQNEDFEISDEHLRLQRSTINELNRHLLSLMESGNMDEGFQASLASLKKSVSTTLSVDALAETHLLRDQNSQLTQEVTSLGEKIRKIELEKSTLIKELFQSRSMGVVRHEDSTFL